MLNSCSDPLVCTQETAFLRLQAASHMRCAPGYRHNNIIVLIIDKQNMSTISIPYIEVSKWFESMHPLSQSKSILNRTSVEFHTSKLFWCLSRRFTLVHRFGFDHSASPLGMNPSPPSQWLKLARYFQVCINRKPSISNIFDLVNLVSIWAYELVLKQFM